LIESCPRKVHSVATCHGLNLGFINLAMIHLMSQLGYIAMMIGAFGNEIQLPLRDDHPEDDLIGPAAQHIVQGRLAWRATCEKYGVDPDAMLGAWPWADLVSSMERLAQEWQQAFPTELVGLDATVVEYAKLIESCRRDFE
jgi:hypothetical protein